MPNVYVCVNILSYLVLVINNKLCSAEKPFQEFKLTCQTKTGQNQVKQLKQKFPTTLTIRDQFLKEGYY